MACLKHLRSPTRALLKTSRARCLPGPSRLPSPSATTNLWASHQRWFGETPTPSPEDRERGAAKKPEEPRTPEEAPSSDTGTPEDPKEQKRESKSQSDSDVTEYKVCITSEDFFDVSTLPVRAVVHRSALWFMNFMFPQLDLKWGPFAEGAAQAVRCVHELLGKENFEELEGLVTPQLLQELRDQKGHHGTEKEDWAEPPRLESVAVMALLTSRSLQEEGAPPGLVITPLIKVTERYLYKGSDKPRGVIRFVKWEFETRILNEGEGGPAQWGSSGWQVRRLEEPWFMPREMVKF